MEKIKTGLMYNKIFADYKAGDGYLYLSSRQNSWISTNDYYDTSERVTDAYNMLSKSGLLDKLIPIESRSATREELVGFHSEKYIEKLETLSDGSGGDIG